MDIESDPIREQASKLTRHQLEGFAPDQVDAGRAEYIRRFRIQFTLELVVMALAFTVLWLALWWLILPPDLFYQVITWSVPPHR